MSDERRGRPTVYTDDLGQKLCDLLSEGKTLNSICKSDEFPSERTVRRWATDDNHPFSPNYALARQAGYLRMADEIVDIADSVSINDVLDPATVQRDRLRVETRKWLLSKALPKIYGEKIQIEARHEHVNGLSDAELERIATGRSEGTAAPPVDKTQLN